MVIRLQRLYRKARAIALFKAKMDRLVFLQVFTLVLLFNVCYVF